MKNAMLMEYAAVGAAIGLIFGTMLDGVVLFVASGSALGLFIAYACAKKGREAKG